MVLHTDYYHNDHINHRCMVSPLNVSLQITENCLYANTKKTEKSKWKQQVRQLDSLSKLRRDIDSMSCALCLKIDGTLK